VRVNKIMRIYCKSTESRYVKLMEKNRLCLLLFLLCSMLPAIVIAADAPIPSGYSDPLESVNRGIFSFNVGVDDYVLEPVARGYHSVTTPGIRNCVKNFVENLHTPLDAVNSLLQGDLRNTGNSMTRFLVNSTFGVAGLFDVAGAENVKGRREDFGQTLAVWGVGSGSYLMLPLLGPSNPRDFIGKGLDWLINPVRFPEMRYDWDGLSPTEKALDVVDTRDRNSENIKSLRENTLDYYASVRSLSWQLRQSAIHNGMGDTENSADSAFKDF
jgi:phospholipid-binding lipoprotein MlaA